MNGFHSRDRIGAPVSFLHMVKECAGVVVLRVGILRFLPVYSGV